MSDLCSPPTFEDLAVRLGFSCEEAGGLVEFRNPAALENWTLPVLEVTIIVGAVLASCSRSCGCAARAIRRTSCCGSARPPTCSSSNRRCTSRPRSASRNTWTRCSRTTCSRWTSCGGRLPLYIVAIYPLMATLAFEIVRMLGVFTRYGVLVGAVCVGFVHHAFYEIFDHLGPQLRWWEWSLENPVNQPFFDAVPIPSVVVFAALWPMSLALCVQFFVGRHVDAGRHFTGVELTWRTVVIGLLASVGTFVLPLPATVLGIGSDTVRGVVYLAELAVVSVVAVVALGRRWRDLRGADVRGTPHQPVRAGVRLGVPGCDGPAVGHRPPPNSSGRSTASPTTVIRWATSGTRWRVSSSPSRAWPPRSPWVLAAAPIR